MYIIDLSLLVLMLRPSSIFASPFLTIVPKADSLDSISLAVRSCVTIRTNIPIRIRIVRLGRALGYLRKRGSKNRIDLAKKGLVAALKRLVDGALIVYEQDDVTNEAPIPLSVLDSSHNHALLIQDNTGYTSDSWRDPVLLTKDFLFNQANIREVSRCHALSGVVIQRVCSQAALTSLIDLLFHSHYGALTNLILFLVQ